MKQMFSIVTGLLLAVSLLGSDQLTLSMSTPGPDTYADGTPVLTGETYLLVYVKAGSAFHGLYTDGSLVDTVNNQIVTKACAVEGSKCGFKAIQYPADSFPGGGSWTIVVLDTRMSDGTVGGLVAGLGASVTADAASALSTSLNAVGGSEAGSTPALTAETPTYALSNVAAPEITAVRQNGGSVDVRFKKCQAGVLYEVLSTTDLAGQWQTVATRVQATAKNIVQGADGVELPTTVQVPVTDKVRFFKVIVPNAAQ